MRSLSGAAQAEIEKQFGAAPLLVLEVQYDSGTVWYSDQPLDPQEWANVGEPAYGGELDARVVSWGELMTRAEPGRLGGGTESTIVMHDADRALRNKINTKPGIQGTVCELSMSFATDVGQPNESVTAWPSRIVLAKGVLTAPQFSAATGTWSFTFRGLEHKYDTELGYRLAQSEFPDVKCQASEGQIIPICFGNPVYRVPGVLIQRPGHDATSGTLGIHDDYLYLQNSLADGGFDTGATAGSPATYHIGWPHNWEEITGYPDDLVNFPNRIKILTRGAILTSGTMPGFATSGGIQFMLLDQDDFADPGPSRAGHALFVKQGNEWVTTFAEMWKLTGDNIIVGYVGDLVVYTGTPWKICRWPGIIPLWPGGTPVYEKADWVYAFNHIPASSVERVEAYSTIQVPGGGIPEKRWYTVDPAWMTITRDNRSYQTELGRNAGDPGITTAAFAQAPATYGIEDNQPYMTLYGPEIETDEVAEYAPDIVNILATHAQLGAIDTADVAQVSMDGETDTLKTDRPVKLAVAITERKKLWDVIGEVAANGTCLAYIDGGKLKCRVWPEFGETVLSSYTESNTAGEPTLEYLDRSEIPTVALGKFKPYPSHAGLVYKREATGAITDFGERERTFELPHIQRPTSAALALEFWFGWYLHRQVMLRVERAYLVKIETEPADTVRIQWTQGTTVVLNRSGIVEQTGHRLLNPNGPQTDQLSVVVAGRLWEYEITAVVPDSDALCDPPAGHVPQLDPSWGYPQTEGETPPGTFTEDSSDSGGAS